MISLLAIALVARGGEPAPEKSKAEFQAADTNADGKVTGAEMTAAMSREAFAAMDKDHNRIITWREWFGADQGPDARQRFDALDKNKDGGITDVEFLASAGKAADIDRKFSALDKNGDGTLSPDEYAGHPHFNVLSIKF